MLAEFLLMFLGYWLPPLSTRVERLAGPLRLRQIFPCINRQELCSSFPHLNIYPLIILIPHTSQNKFNSQFFENHLPNALMIARWDCSVPKLSSSLAVSVLIFPVTPEMR